jgi:hypothetical protein
MAVFFELQITNEKGHTINYALYLECYEVMIKP